MSVSKQIQCVEHRLDRVAAVVVQNEEAGKSLFSAMIVCYIYKMN